MDSEIKKFIPKDKIYFETELGILINADCMDILPLFPDNSFSLCLTDPPYGIGKMVSGTMSKERLHKSNYDSFEDSIEYVKKIIIPAITQVLKKSKRAIITPGSKCLNFYPNWNSYGNLYFPASVGMQKWGAMDSQPIIYYGKPYDIGKKIHKCSYTVTEKASCKEHPCSKPQMVWNKFINKRTKKGHLVIDPFMGSGTTAVSCEKLNRRWVGVELSETYCRVAKERIDEEARQGKFNL